MAIWIDKDKLTTDLCEYCQNCKNNEPCENCEVMAVIEEQPETWWTFKHGPVKILVDIRELDSILFEECSEHDDDDTDCEHCKHAETCEIRNRIYDLPQYNGGSGVPVGKWSEKYTPDEEPLWRRKYYCSVCGGWNSYGFSDFCPRCGAKMDGERGQNEAD